MRDYFTDLVEIIDKECQIYAELKSVEEEKKKVIIDNDVKALEAITKKEQGFVKTIVNLEELRAQVIDGFCQFKGVKELDTLDEIIALLNEDERAKMELKKEKLVSIVNDLMQVNHLNSKLLEQSLDYLEETMSLAKSFSEADVGYKEDARDRTVKVDKNLFDAKI